MELSLTYGYETEHKSFYPIELPVQFMNPDISKSCSVSYYVLSY
jgi:hypothetical protein